MAYAWEPSFEHGKDGRRIRGSFTPSGAGLSVATGAIRGTGFSVAYVSTGLFRLTLDENFMQLIEGQCSYQGATADTSPVTVTLGDVVVANRTVDIQVWVETAGSLAKADITASGIARRINFDLTVGINDYVGTGSQA